jgi:peroxiredoxin
MKPRFVILLFLLALVLGSTIWRVMTPRHSAEKLSGSVDSRMAPSFQLLDQKNRPIQLNGYLNRYRILLCFFDAAKGPDGDSTLQQLKQCYADLKRAGIMVFAISSPLGPDHKATALTYPFPILRDTLAGQRGSCCALWGRAKFSEGSTTPVIVRPATFFIEADGLVTWEGDAPKPVEDPQMFIASLIDGMH